MTLPRKYLSSFMAIAIALGAAACGGGGGGENNNNVIPLDCDNPGEGEQTWKLTSLTLPTGEEEPPIGFDLDDHDTSDAEDPVGCGVIDGSGGVDNALGGLLALASGFLGDTDLDALIAESIASGDIDVLAVVTGYEGPGDDQVLISLVVNGEPVAGAQDLCAGVNAAGDIVGMLPSLPIAIPEVEIDPEMAPISLTLDLSDVNLVITNPSAGSVADAELGGGVLWDDGAGNGIGPDVQEIVDALIGGIDVNSLAASFLDLGPDGACDTISLGVLAQFTQQ